LFDHIGEDRVFLSVAAAVNAFQTDAYAEDASGQQVATGGENDRPDTLPLAATDA
jgi:hypothetical protein